MPLYSYYVKTNMTMLEKAFGDKIPHEPTYYTPLPLSL